VQRRLHRQHDDSTSFYKEPIDEQKIRNTAARLNLTIDFVYGELPHFSSTLVRRAPGHWRSFLTETVVQYLDVRPHLLNQLIENLEADAAQELGNSTTVERPQQPSSLFLHSQAVAAGIVMIGLEAVHALQYERGHVGLRLSTDQMDQLTTVQQTTDALLKEVSNINICETDLQDLDEVQSLATELKQIPVWLEVDRAILNKRATALAAQQGTAGWLARWAVVEKFNPRIDVLMAATIRALTEILDRSTQRTADADRGIPDLLREWIEGKEALGRLRAFVCSGGLNVRANVRASLKLRKRLNEVIDAKDRKIARVLSLEANMLSRHSAPDALLNLLERVTALEYKLMGCFASTTPLESIHKLLETTILDDDEPFNVEEFFQASTAALDFLLSFSRALAATAVAAA
jgi:hypothetical protein